VADAIFRRGASETRFLGISVSDAPEDVIGVIRAGARGYVTKSHLPYRAGRRHPPGAQRRRRLLPGLAGFVLDAFRGDLPTSIDPELDQLTPREREVLRHIARGFTYKEIGVRLNLSAKTVETHVSSVLRKLQLSSRYELTRWRWIAA